jgi:hypothetical protein
MVGCHQRREVVVSRSDMNPFSRNGTSRNGTAGLRESHTIAREEGIAMRVRLALPARSE